MNIIQEKAKYLVLNCQTNSSNHGMNIITKYHRADVFTLDQQEINLAYPSYSDDDEAKLRKLEKHLNGIGWLTRGALGAMQTDHGDVQECPAFTLSVKDTIGAGDAFFALAGIFAAAGAPAKVGTFIRLRLRYHQAAPAIIGAFSALLIILVISQVFWTRI